VILSEVTIIRISWHSEECFCLILFILARLKGRKDVEEGRVYVA